jgi:hypothetical protein
MLVKHDLVVERRVGDDVVIMQQENMRFHLMNESAAVIWEAIDGTRDEKQIAEIVAERYDMPVDDVMLDVRETIEALRDLKLLNA